MLSPERGAQTIRYLAASPAIAGETSLYFEENRPKRPAPLALDDALAERLWRESARLTHRDSA